MKKRIIALAMLVAPTLFFVGCKKSDDVDDNPTPQEQVSEKAVVENYANIVLANYEDALKDAKKLKQAIDAFVDEPTAEKFEAAKNAWLVSRESYGPSEAYRFASGPIDDEDGPEGLLNSWPLDENFIDYVDGMPNAGIINNVTEYPEITKDLLVELNQQGSEENVSTGYHAIEFLLWGQDLTDPSENKAGLREYTDYTTAANADRRGKYLKICADLLIEHLESLISDWKEGGAYRTEFLAMDTKKALSNMITGIAILSKSELAGERMYVALESQKQEDEHSCFSDNTHRDIRLNFDGIENVYKGQYGTIKGASIAQLLEEKNPQEAENMKKAIDDAKAKVYATQNPFDIAISGGKTSPEGKKVADAVTALQKLGDELVVAADAIGTSASAAEEE